MDNNNTNANPSNNDDKAHGFVSSTAPWPPQQAAPPSNFHGGPSAVPSRKPAPPPGWSPGTAEASISRGPQPNGTAFPRHPIQDELDYRAANYGAPQPPSNSNPQTVPLATKHPLQEELDYRTANHGAPQPPPKNSNPQTVAPAARNPVHSYFPAPNSAAATVPSPPPPKPQHQPPPQQQQQQQQPPTPGGLRELRVEDALLYLDDVKHEFRDQPAIYNEFLAIMKNFKTQEVDTPGVINRVSRLFRGYNNLILGFNTFLPEGYKIRLEDLVRQDQEHAREQAALAKQHQEQQQQQAAAESAAAAAGKAPAARTQYPPLFPQQQQQQQQPPPAAAAAAAPKQAAWQQKPPEAAPSGLRFNKAPRKAAAARKPARPSPPRVRAPPQPPQQQHQAVEFDHAISYVTKIKRRFSNDPSIYHSFLEILHNYQREQRGIKEVLELVAHLFQDHPDLLKEFTFFLPDAVQEQAKERLHRAAAESESRLQAAQRKQQEKQQPKLIDMTHKQQGDRKRHSDQHKKAPAAPKAAPATATEQPETYVYNSAVERQFFDATKEALTAYTRDGGQAWSEFLKCLDMYAQEILSRNEMLNFVEPLLGKRHTKLFQEFKRILAAAGTGSAPTEESWYSVPLSEIDFSRCRRCSPSYRALPRDYPAHPCSGRNLDEAKVLNDVWVSLPVGSEESYTFRHMRRNTYEETLFRVEDERFEIDMVIDSNAATLQRLLPIAEEIALLAQSTEAEGGLAGKRFQYSFDDQRILGVIHRNTIARIYGDSGQEMLDLLVKNPAVAVPLVVERLRQKDTEWRAVRDRLNGHWRELAEQNYYKSLDHRGLTWRTIDKRATSTRTMIAEMKDRATHAGAEGVEALKFKLDKAKEEHGTFFEVTMGDKLSKKLDLTFLPKPDRRIFTPHLSLMYSNNSWAQRDAYRILAFALERGPISPADKERCHRLWVDFLGPWFNLSLNWMQKPAVAYQESTRAAPSAEAMIVSEEDDDESMDEESSMGGGVVSEELRQAAVSDIKGQSFSDHHPLPAETHVSTLYGEGKILAFRRAENLYVVQLDFGATGYLRPATILCSILPVEKSSYTRQLRENDPTKLARPGDQLAFGTQSLYLFFRLHQILVQRLNTAKRLAFSVDDDRSLVTLIEQMPDVNRKVIGRRRYEAYLSLVYALLDGGVGGATEGGKYEDRVRSLLGHGGYELATMDKLISHIWKNLQALAGDETMWNLVQLYRRHAEAGTFQPEAFRLEAAYLSDGEAMYAFQHCPVSGKDESVLYMEYVGVMDDDEDAEEDDNSEPSTKRQRQR